MKIFNSFAKHVFNKKDRSSVHSLQKEYPKNGVAELNIAWSHYQQLLNMRLKYSSFSVLFSTFLVGGFLTTFQISPLPHPAFRLVVGVFIGVLLMICSYVFMKMDERNEICRNHIKKIIENIETHERYPEHLKLSRMIEVPHRRTPLLAKILYLTFLFTGLFLLIGSLIAIVNFIF